MSLPEFRYIGRAIPRKEDKRFVTGTGRYLDDIEVAGALHACFVRSPHAHARIASLDCDAARTMPGVVAVVTGHDLARWTTRHRMAPAIDGLQPVEMDSLPTERVRFHGDPVACVVATDRYLAEDAAEQVFVDYEVLDAVTDMWRALEPDAPRVDETLSSNLVSHQSAAFGDVDARMREAHRVVESTFSQHRQTHVPIETRGCIAIWDEGREHLTFHVGNQVPHPYRTMLANRLRLSESQVSVISPDVGGGFGQKITLYREELAVAALARELRRPVRWREDRMENLSTSTQAREDFCRTRAAVDAEGRVLALELEILEDFGAYCFYPGNYLARVVAMILTGPYKVQDYRYDVKVVLTNKVRQRADARADGRDQLGHGRHPRRDRARARARPHAGAPAEHGRGGRAAPHDAHRRGAARRDPARDLRGRARGGRLRWLPCPPGPGARAGPAARPGHLQRDRVHHLRVGLLQVGGDPGFGPRVGVAAHRTDRCGQRVGRARRDRPGLRDRAVAGGGRWPGRGTRARSDPSRSYRHRPLRHGQPRRARRHRGRRRALPLRAGCAGQGAGDRGAPARTGRRERAAHGRRAHRTQRRRGLAADRGRAGRLRARGLSRPDRAARRRRAGAGVQPQLRPAAHDLLQRRARLRGGTGRRHRVA